LAAAGRGAPANPPGPPPAAPPAGEGAGPLQPPRPGEVDRLADQPADRPRLRQPHLEALLRLRHQPVAGGIGIAGPVADAPRTARLACERVPERLGREEARSPAGPRQRLPPVFYPDSRPPRY